MKSDEERREALREANRRYYQSEKGRANTARKNASPAAKAAQERYRASETYRATKERTREARAEYQRRYTKEVRRLNPERLKARAAIDWALRSGYMKRPEICSRCWRRLKVEAHHHLGWDRKHWLDIQWLCHKCHRAIH